MKAYSLFLIFFLIFSISYAAPKKNKTTQKSELQLLREEMQTLKDKVEKLEGQKINNPAKPEENSKEKSKVVPNEEEEAVSKSLEKRPHRKYNNARKKGLKIQELSENNIGKRYAIVIGINNYEDISISNLSKARNDAIVMAKLLEAQGQFEKVFLMTDDIDNKGKNRNLYPTRLNILAKLDSVLNFATSDDMVLFFFSGHGISDYDENGYLVTVDTLAEHKFNSSLKVHEIVSRLQKKGIKKSLLILDACRDKIYTSKSTQQNPLRQEQFESAELAATFYSTKAGYYSYEDEDSDFGVFTKHLVYGIEGQADSNKDGVVTFGELKLFVQQSVRDWSLKNNKEQKPYVKIYGESYGDLAISITPVLPEKGESLADRRIPKKTRIPYIWRSAVLPGWGQYHDDSKNRGYVYMATGAVLGYYYLSNRLQLDKLQKNYDSGFVLPGSLLLPTYLDMQSRKDALIKQESKTDIAYYLFMSFWAWNIYDAAVYEKQDGFRFWEFAMYPRLTPNTISSTASTNVRRETFGKLNFFKKF
ncbi:MAG: caspase family protein [Leptospiraceae bacterium]|nr:caspase family protein [Leptospiraceae bacterium]MCP5501607.1 caspase family protein [Leptospiraceae bacterium]